ncbi:ferritin-like domain-containing protein [Spirillospora sp. CA-108201]
MAEFLTDVKTLRERARQEIDKGPITEAYGADVERVIQVCNEALATEIVCVLRYKRHYYTATGIHAETVASEFLQHAAEEQQHADMLAERIVQLGDGDPTTKRVFEQILAQEEEHADDLRGFLERFPKS